MELAHESCCLGNGNQVSETDVLRISIQDILNTSIDPYISSPHLLPPGASASLDMDSGGLSSTTSSMAALAHQTSAILTDITSQASMGEDEALEGFGNILRPEEPYSSWTMTSSHYVSAGLLPNFHSSFDGYQDLSFNYGPFEGGVNIQPQPSTATDWASSRKGKEILLEETDLVLARGKELAPSPILNSLQQELLEKLRSPPGVLPASPKTLSPGYGSMRPVGKMPPGHISSSLFRPHNRHLQFPRAAIKKRKPLIYKWATSLALMIKRNRDEMVGAGGSSFDGLSPGTEGFDPRSPNSVAHDQQAAVAHKIAERNRRMKFSHKLQTLISIVPMVNKKKDKVSVLTSTIDYIRQLNLRISTLKKLEEEAMVPATSRLEAEGGSANLDREEELSMFNEADRPSSSSPIGGAPAVVVEGAPGDDTWVIKVEANNRSRSLIQLLNVLLELELGVVTVDYGSLNGRFHANICVKNSRSSSTSRGELQERLCRVLEARDSSVTGSD